MVYAALLRAVNVGGHNMVKMADLCRVATACGLEDVSSLLQSGNLVFRGRKATTASIERRLESAARDALRLETDFMVRTGAEWDEMIASNPFRREVEEEPGRLLMMCLKQAPAAASVKALEKAVVGDERVALVGADLYVVYPDGVGVSKLTNKVIEKTLGTPGTGRNWNTVRRIQQALQHLAS